MKNKQEIQIQVGRKQPSEDEEYYQYNIEEFTKYMNDVSDEYLERRPCNHNEDNKGEFEREPLKSDLISLIKKMADCPEQVLKGLERAVNENKLELIGIHLKSDDLKYIVLFLQQHSYIKSLNISYNFIDDMGAEILCDLSLENLDVSINDLTDKGASLIAEKMKLNFLNISNNDLGDKGAKNIAIAIKNCSIKEAKVLKNKDITEIGKLALTEAFNTSKIINMADSVAIKINSTPIEEPSCLQNIFSCIKSTVFTPFYNFLPSKSGSIKYPNDHASSPNDIEKGNKQKL